MEWISGVAHEAFGAVFANRQSDYTGIVDAKMPSQYRGSVCIGRVEDSYRLLVLVLYVM